VGLELRWREQPPAVPRLRRYSCIWNNRIRLSFCSLYVRSLSTLTDRTHNPQSSPSIPPNRLIHHPQLRHSSHVPFNSSAVNSIRILRTRQLLSLALRLQPTPHSQTHVSSRRLSAPQRHTTRSSLHSSSGSTCNFPGRSFSWVLKSGKSVVK
jgi:hypothetical protein